jgi:hypothetical protein
MPDYDKRLTYLCTIVAWTWLTMIVAFLFFYPVLFRLKNKIGKSIQLCFVFLFENIAFVLYMLLVIIITLPVSLLFFFLFPGPAGIILWINVCFKIRLYKYDYLEAHPGTDRKKIPWRCLILEDEERVGKRTVRGMIFPWKS